MLRRVTADLLHEAHWQSAINLMQPEWVHYNLLVDTMWVVQRLANVGCTCRHSSDSVIIDHHVCLVTFW